MSYDSNSFLQLFTYFGYNPDNGAFVPADYNEALANPEKKSEYCFDKIKALVDKKTAVNKVFENDVKFNLFHNYKRKLQYQMTFNSDWDVDVGN